MNAPDACCGSATAAASSGTAPAPPARWSTGGPLDVLTGDWLAELTMYILHKTRERSGGYARTFLRELEEVLPTCIERGITVVSNAGGLHPEALAAAVGELARRQGLDVHVASVSGDDITPGLAALQAQGEKFVNLDTGEVLPAGASVVTANAYLRARPIADALAAGAQVVVTGRVTDAALVVGPALHAFGWSDADLDAIAGAVVAGHVIECGAQCCGGNYAFFEEVPGRERIGFPLAELSADGSSVITKHPGTGGMVTVGTVTAQLLYEIGGPRYLSPDAVARFDSIQLAQEGPDRVRIAPVRGEAPPATLKVTANLDAGWRNAMTLALTGAQVAEKARFAAEAVWAGVPGGRDGFAETAEDLSGDLTGAGMAYLRLAVRGDDEQSVGRAFSGAVVETSLSSYPGTFFTSAPSGAQGVARYWPTTVRCRRRLPARRVRRPTDRRLASDGVRPRGRCGCDCRTARRRRTTGPAGRADGDGPAVGARRRPLGGQGRRRQCGRLGRRRCRGGVAPERLLRGAVQDVAAGGRGLLGQPLPLAEPAGRELRGARRPWLGCRLEPPPGHAGEGPRGAAALPSGRGARRVGGERPGRGEARRALTARPGRSGPGIWQDGARGVGRPSDRADRGHHHCARHRLERVHRARRATGDVLAGHATAGPGPRWLGPPGGAEAPGLRDARSGPVVRRARRHGLSLRALALLHRFRHRADRVVCGGGGLRHGPRHLGVVGLHARHRLVRPGGTAGRRSRRGRDRPPGRRPRDRLPPDAVHPVLHPRDRGDAVGGAVGNPAWGPEILARHHWLDVMDELPPLYSDWERWAAAVSESHANYPGLLWFRSPVSTRSWLVGLVAMMDSAALYHAASPSQTPRQARLCLSMGINCLRSMARALRIPYDDDPLPTASVRLSRQEFDEGFRRLESVNFPAERTADDAWRHFQGWRVNYEPIVDALTAIIVPPPAPWFIVRPALGMAKFPLVLNRTPDEPEGAQGFGVNKTFKTPSARESNNS